MVSINLQKINFISLVFSFILAVHLEESKIN
jgi:hypothetical protein